MMVCARCEISVACACAGTTQVPTRLSQWFDLHVWSIPPVIMTLDGVANDEPVFGDVVEIAAHRFGKFEDTPWIAIVKLADDRWCYLNFTLRADEQFWAVVVAASFDRLWWAACTDEDRARFTRQRSRDDLDAELVQLDAMLESDDPSARTLAEGRMRQRKRLGL